jgi:hypothetical protein
VLEVAGDATGAESAYAEASALQPSTFFRAQPYNRAAVARGEALPRDPEAGPEQIDLSPFYNARLVDACLGLEPRNNLSLLPAGLQRFDRVRFDVRGIVQLARESSRLAQGREYPERVQGIPVGLKARRLHFLHGTGWTEADGVEVGSYVVHYADGLSEKLPIRYASELRDWYVATSTPSPAERAAVAWSGPTPGAQQVCLYHWAWENPHPELEIASIDFMSTQTMCAPFLIAITAEP